MFEKTVLVNKDLHSKQTCREIPTLNLPWISISLHHVAGIHPGNRGLPDRVPAEHAKGRVPTRDPTQPQARRRRFRRWRNWSTGSRRMEIPKRWQSKRRRLVIESVASRL